jgi:serine O-acetyltransferase
MTQSSEDSRDPAPKPAEAKWALGPIVAALRESREVSNKIRHRGRVRELPSRAALVAILDAVGAALFPTHYGRPDLTDETIDGFVATSLESALTALAEQIRRSLFFVSDQDQVADADLRQKAIDITQDFAGQLTAIRALLVSDLLAALQGDPAATSISEILLCYPGFGAILHYRLAHVLRQSGAPFIARMISSIAHSVTGIDIHPAARIGAGFFIDHGTGVVIGETAIIGNNVRLYQAVTLGARRLPAAEDGSLIKGRDRHPIIEDNVVIYAGATILGRITIGRDSTIGGNVWLTQSVPPGSIVTQAQTRQGDGERAARSNGHRPDLPPDAAPDTPQAAD